MTRDFSPLALGSSGARVFEAGVLELLEREIGFDVGAFLVQGAGGLPAVRGLAPESVERMVAGAAVYQRELLPIKTAALAARGVAVDTSVLGARRVERQRYYQDVARPLGGRHSLFAVLSWQGRPFASLMLGRTGAAGFKDREIERMEAWVPDLSVARAAFGHSAPAEPLPSSRPGFLRRVGLSDTSVRASVKTPQGTLTVRDQGAFREMVASEGDAELVWSRAALSDAARSGWPYVDLFHVVCGLAATRRRALVVGCGGAVVVRQLVRACPGIDVDLVECEPEVIRLARDWFDLNALPGVTVHVGDGVRFVQQAARDSWDLAIIDAFDSSRVVQETIEAPFFRALSRVVQEGGAVGMNVIGSLDGGGAVASAARAALEAFEDVRLLPVLEPDEEYARETRRNVVVVAARPRKTP